eukprot:COSAG02_NODE_60630_length_270_cov_6.321637_1_plen_59_part_01
MYIITEITSSTCRARARVRLDLRFVPARGRGATGTRAQPWDTMAEQAAFAAIERVGGAM